jgi:photosystem II stability/assembly factor-like uncharacterized protein
MTKPLYSVSCASVEACTAVGANGTILTSGDGGASWTSRQPGTKLYSLYSVSCPTATFCVAVGGVAFDATILLSKNAGANWASYVPGFDDILSGSNSPSGMATAMTLDCASGSLCSGGVLRGVSCPSTSFCAAVGDQGTVLTTADAGAAWTSQVAAGGSAKLQLTGVSCTASRSCVAVGQAGEILRMS